MGAWEISVERKADDGGLAWEVGESLKDSIGANAHFELRHCGSGQRGLKNQLRLTRD